MKSLSFAAVLLFAASSLMAAHPGWSDNYAESLAKAKKEDKFVLLNFTGSDWCPPCKILEKDYFSNPEFKAFAEKNLVLVEIDFPMGTSQAPDLREQNRKLQEKFRVEGFPTNFILTPSGKPISTFNFPQTSPKQFVAEIRELVEKQRAN